MLFEDIKSREALVLMVIQYLGIALLIAFAGYLLNRSIERHRARLAVATEVAKKRVQFAADCWNAVFKWEEAVDRLVSLAAELRLKSADDEQFAAELPRLAPIQDNAKALSSSALGVIAENRFWLGEPLVAEFLDYGSLLNDYLGAFQAADMKGMRLAVERIAAKRGSLSKVLAKLP
jgi:hypothetical protein